MAWASNYIAKLQAGKAVTFKPRGNSMSGLINSGDTCLIEPIGKGILPVLVGDIVLCKVKGNQYLHVVKAIKGAQFQIGNAHGNINGWITINGIYGVCCDIVAKDGRYGTTSTVNKLSKVRPIK